MSILYFNLSLKIIYLYREYIFAKPSYITCDGLIWRECCRNHSRIPGRFLCSDAVIRLLGCCPVKSRIDEPRDLPT